MAERDLSYCRRLDRSPEKLSPHLSSENIKAITDVRLAVENVRKKFDELNDNLDERDKAVEVERTLKEKAEEKLKSRLVDMYQDDGHVNSELRNRLPRANKTDPLSSTHYHSDDEVSFRNMPLEKGKSCSENFGKIKKSGISRSKRNLSNDFDRRKSDQPYNNQAPTDEFFPLTRARSVPHQLQSTQQPLHQPQPQPQPPYYTVNYQTQPTPIAQSTPFHSNPYNDSGFVPSYGSSLPNINISDPKMGNKFSANAYVGSNCPSNFTTNNFGPMENHLELKTQNEDLKGELDFIKIQMENQRSELNYYKSMCDEYCKKEVTVDDIFNIMKEKSERNGSHNGKDGQDKLESTSDKTNFSFSELDDESIPTKEETYEVHKRFIHAYKEKSRRKKEIIESRMKILICQRNYFQMQVKQLQQELLMAKIRKNDTACSMTELEEDFNNLRLTHSMLTYEFFPEDEDQATSGKQNNT